MAGDTTIHIHVEGESCLGVRKGAWTKEEDDLLKHCILKHGEGNWHKVSSRAGLNRCWRSCRMRWLNYLKPDIDNGEFREDEVDLLIRLHKLLGNRQDMIKNFKTPWSIHNVARWSLIAGRLPGRTSNNVKNYWNTHLRKKVGDDPYRQRKDKGPHEKGIQYSKVNIIKPRPRTWTLNKKLQKMISKKPRIISDENDIQRPQHNLTIDDGESTKDPSPALEDENRWWESFIFDTEITESSQTLPSFSIVDDDDDDHQYHLHQVLPNIGDSTFGDEDHQNYWRDYYSTIDMDPWGVLNADK